MSILPTQLCGEYHLLPLDDHASAAGLYFECISMVDFCADRRKLELAALRKGDQRFQSGGDHFGDRTAWRGELTAFSR